MDEKTFKLTPFPERNDLFYPDLKINISKTVPTALSLFHEESLKERTLIPILQKKEGWKKLQESNISNIFFIILDALGFEHFMRYSEKLKSVFETNGIALSSVFPTITSTCMVSIHNGVMPAKHGILGHKIHFREIDNIVDTLTLKTKESAANDLTSMGVNVRNWLWSNYLKKNSETISFFDLIEHSIANSGLSYFINEANQSIGYSSHIDCFSAAKKILETSSKTKKFLDLYVGSIDAISHRYSTDSQALADEVKLIEDLLVKMLKRLDPKVADETALFITADHGQENLHPDKRVLFTQEDEPILNSLLKARGRSGRVVHLYPQEDKIDETIRFFEEKIGEKGVVITSNQYPQFLGKGANSPNVINRLGAIQVILGENASLYFGHQGEFDSLFGLGLNATHGSLGRNELVVPFLFGRVKDFIR